LLALGGIEFVQTIDSGRAVASETQELVEPRGGGFGGDEQQGAAAIDGSGRNGRPYGTASARHVDLHTQAVRSSEGYVTIIPPKAAGGHHQLPARTRK
jgi:hypothetical protein